MSARGFRSISMVAGVAAAALGCYMVSLRVASERAALEDVENRIVLAQRDIRVLQTEIGTRGRLAQLESWNVKVLALSAPEANQFVEGGFALASMVAPKKLIDPSAPVVLASAPAPERKPQLSSDGPEPGLAAKDLMRVASFKRDLGPVEGENRPQPNPEAKPVKQATENQKKTVEKPAPSKAAEAAKPAKAAKPSTDSAKTPAPTKPTAKSAAEKTKTAANKTPTTKPSPTKPAQAKTATAKDTKAKQ